MADTEPGLFGIWRQMRRERKAGEAMTAEMPPDIAAEITADAAGLNDPEPARGRSESLREFLQRTPHRYALDPSGPLVARCMCCLGRSAGIHDGPELLDTRAYIAARLEEIRAGWPAAGPEGAAEEMPRETIAAEPAPPSDGVLGYLVAYTYRADGGVEGVTHTTLMDLESARKEAKAHGVSPVRRWFPVELRRVDGG